MTSIKKPYAISLARRPSTVAQLSACRRYTAAVSRYNASDLLLAELHLNSNCYVDIINLYNVDRYWYLTYLR